MVAWMRNVDFPTDDSEKQRPNKRGVMIRIPRSNGSSCTRSRCWRDETRQVFCDN